MTTHLRLLPLSHSHSCVAMYLCLLVLPHGSRQNKYLTLDKQSLTGCLNVAGDAMMADLNRKIVHVIFYACSACHFQFIQYIQPENKEPMNQLAC